MRVSLLKNLNPPSYSHPVSSLMKTQLKTESSSMRRAQPWAAWTEGKVVLVLGSTMSSSAMV